MSISERLWDLLFPPKCPFCGRLLEKGTLLCPDCQRDLPWLAGTAAETQVELTEGCVSALRYQDKVRTAIHAYKFRGRSARSKPFGILLSQSLILLALCASVSFDLCVCVVWQIFPRRHNHTIYCCLLQTGSP